MSLVLNLEILGEYKNLTAATKGAQSQLGALNKKVSSVSNSIKGSLAAIGIGFSLAGIVNGLQDAVAAAEEVRQADQRLGNIAKSMNLFGKETDTVVKRLGEFAQKQETLTGVDGEVIKLTQAKLLTFGELAKSAGKMGGAFDRATLAAMDMAAAGFGTAEGNAVQLGKALNDPIKGINSLTKSGITFTDEEKKKIETLVKSNKMLEAQDLVLKAIEMQVGGTAEATGLSSEKIKRAFEGISEQIGTFLLPYLDAFSAWLNTSEGQQKLQEIIDFVQMIIDKFVEMATWVVENKDWLVPLLATLGTLKVVWEGVTSAIDVAKTAQSLFASEAVSKAGIAMKAWAPLAALLGIAAVSDWASTTLQTDTGRSKQIIGGAFSLNSTAKPSAGGSNMVIQNVEIKSSQSAQQIKSVLQRSAKANGTKVLGLGGL